jgi:hypothetical protein
MGAVRSGYRAQGSTVESAGRREKRDAEVRRPSSGGGSGSGSGRVKEKEKAKEKEKKRRDRYGWDRLIPGYGGANSSEDEKRRRKATRKKSGQRMRCAIM